jgi:LAO/AO transport system kinase
MEIGDIFVVNKADRPGADRLRQEIEVTLGIRAGNAFRHVRAHHGGQAKPPMKTDGTVGTDASVSSVWQHPVLATVATKGDGVAELVAALETHHAELERSGGLAARRRRRLFDRTREVVDRATRQWLWQETGAEQLIRDRLGELEAGRASPYDVAAEVLDALKQGSRV